MSVLDDILAAKKPEIRTTRICLDPELAERLAIAKAAYDRAKRSSDANTTDRAAASAMESALDEYKAADAAASGSMVTFTFGPVDDPTFEKLKAENRPTESQKTDARKKGEDVPEWNPDTFSPLYIAAACIKVEGPTGAADGISVDEAKALWADGSRWNEADRAELFNTAFSARITRTRLVDGPKAD